MRPGYPDVLVTESHAEAFVATIALGVTGRDHTLWTQASEAVSSGCAGIGFEGQEVPTVLSALVDLGQLNSLHFSAPERVRQEANAFWAPLRRRASLLRMSDYASSLLREYVHHPGFSADEGTAFLPAVVDQLQVRRPIKKYFGNKR